MFGILFVISVPLVWIGINGILSGGIQLSDLSGYDFKTPALYFFSAVAQTMGALLAISFAVLYTLVINIKPSDPTEREQLPAYEPLKRLITNDPILVGSVKCGLITIAVALISIIALFFFQHQLVRMLIFSIGSILIIINSILSIGFMIKFIRSGLGFYTNPISVVPHLLGDYKHNQALTVNSNTINNCIEIMILNRTQFGETYDNKPTHYIPYHLAIILSSLPESKFDNVLLSIMRTTIKDIKLVLTEHHLQQEKIKTIIGDLLFDLNSYFKCSKFEYNEHTISRFSLFPVRLTDENVIDNDIHKKVYLGSHEPIRLLEQINDYNPDFLFEYVYYHFRVYEEGKRSKSIGFSNLIVEYVVRGNKPGSNDRFTIGYKSLSEICNKEYLSKCILFSVMHNIRKLFIYEGNDNFEEEFRRRYTDDISTIYNKLWYIILSMKIDNNNILKWIKHIKYDLRKYSEYSKKDFRNLRIIENIISRKTEYIGEIDNKNKIEKLQRDIFQKLELKQVPKI